jgi:hypothetical protein
MPKDRHGGDRTSHFTRRRIFVGGVASVIGAPAIVRAQSLMPIRALIVPMQSVHAGFIERLRFHWMEQALKNGWTTERDTTSQISLRFNSAIVTPASRGPGASSPRMTCDDEDRFSSSRQRQQQ